jgi:hypothetical protein
MHNTLDILSDNGLTHYHNAPIHDKRDGKDWVTWPNHQSGRYNCESHFAKINQYKKIVETEAFTCLLFDGSLVRAAYGFNNETLMIHNLLWWPSPFRITSEDLVGGGILDFFDLYADSGEWHERLEMRTPFRFDYDTEKAAEDHPLSHLHMQTSDCRLYIDRPLSFNRFITFIFKNFYPDVYKKHYFWGDLVDIKLVDDSAPPQMKEEAALSWLS